MPSEITAASETALLSKDQHQTGQANRSPVSNLEIVPSCLLVLFINAIYWKHFSFQPVQEYPFMKVKILRLGTGTAAGFPFLKYRFQDVPPLLTVVQGSSF